VRTVVSGVLRQAVLHGALAANPVHELSRIRDKPSKPRALTPEERRRWLQFLATDESAVRRDLHDLTVLRLRVRQQSPRDVRLAVRHFGEPATPLSCASYQGV